MSVTLDWTLYHRTWEGHCLEKLHFFLSAMQILSASLPSMASITSRTVISRACRASEKPPLTPRYDRTIFAFTSFWRILARKLRGILYSSDISFTKLTFLKGWRARYK